MTAIASVTLYCDHADPPDGASCPETFDCGERRAGDTRAKAALEGWAHRLIATENRQGAASSEDLCPEHAAKR